MNGSNGNNRRNGDRPLRKLMNMWPILFALLVLASSHGMFKRDVKSNAEQTSENKKKLDIHETRLSKVEQIVENIPIIMSDIKLILGKMR